jgi:flagellar basal-body rod protein FlgF
MENTSYVALSRQTALWRQLEVVANNMANTNTPAYKGEQMMFTEYLSKSRSGDRAMGDKVAFVQDIGLVRDIREGTLSKTDNKLDVAIHGDGFFVIDTAEGQRFTRNGHFRLDEAGMLVTTDGAAVMQTGDTPIILAPNESRIEIARDGTVSSENGVVGKLHIVKFQNEQELRKVGASLYDSTSAPEDVTRPEIHQGMLEESNVEPIVEITKMIDIMRTYQGVQNLIDTEHERQRKAIQVFGQTQNA